MNIPPALRAAAVRLVQLPTRLIVGGSRRGGVAHEFWRGSARKVDAGSTTCIGGRAVSSSNRKQVPLVNSYLRAARREQIVSIQTWGLAKAKLLARRLVSVLHDRNDRQPVRPGHRSRISQASTSRAKKFQSLVRRLAALRHGLQAVAALRCAS
jgi:hypothetical protein